METTIKIKKAKLKPHYVDNKKFLEAMVEYRNKCIKAEDKNRKKPDVTNYIHLMHTPDVTNHTYLTKTPDVTNHIHLIQTPDDTIYTHLIQTPDDTIYTHLPI